MNNSSHPAIFFIAYTAKAHEGLEAIPADTGWDNLDRSLAHHMANAARQATYTLMSVPPKLT